MCANYRKNRYEPYATVCKPGHTSQTGDLRCTWVHHAGGLATNRRHLAQTVAPLWKPLQTVADRCRIVHQGARRRKSCRRMMHAGGAKHRQKKGGFRLPLFYTLYFLCVVRLLLSSNWYSCSSPRSMLLISLLALANNILFISMFFCLSVRESTVFSNIVNRSRYSIILLSLS